VEIDGVPIMFMIGKQAINLSILTNTFFHLPTLESVERLIYSLKNCYAYLFGWITTIYS